MSEVKRYTPSMRVGHMVKDKDGLWNRSQDFERVTAERDAYKETLDRWHELNLQREAKVDDLQLRLTEADERADVLTKALTDVGEALGREYWDQYAGLDETRDILDAALKQAEVLGDE